MRVGLLSLHLHIPGCGSLKEKRRRLKPLIVRLQREFNISIAEVDHLEVWQSALLAVALVSNDHKHVQRSLLTVAAWVEANWPDVEVVDDVIEML